MRLIPEMLPGAAPAIIAAATATATARHFAETCLQLDDVRPLSALCERAALACATHVGGALSITVVMVDFDGDQVIARG